MQFNYKNNQVEEINYQCDGLVQDILSEARSQAQSSETAVEQSIPQNRLNFCNLISSYETCTNLDQCDTYVSNNDTSNFVCSDVCGSMNINNCELVDGCIFRNNKCLSRSILDLNDDQIQQYQMQVTYQSVLLFQLQQSVIEPTYNTLHYHRQNEDIVRQRQYFHII